MIFNKHSYKNQKTPGMEWAPLLQDLTSSYSITLATRTSKDEFYSFVSPNNESIFKFAQKGHRRFGGNELDRILSQVTRDLVINGESLLVLEEEIKDDSMQSWHFRTLNWESYIKKNGILIIKHGNEYATRCEKIDSNKVVHFYLCDIGLPKDVFKKVLRRIVRTNIVSIIKPEFFYNKSYDYFQHSKACELEFLNATKHIYWNGRSPSNQYTSEPYLLYKRGKWLQLRLMILDYLISRINDFIKNYGRQYDLSGEIQYHACFSKEELNSLLDQYTIGKVMTAELRDYLFQH